METKNINYYIPTRPWWMPKFVYHWFLTQAIKMLGEMPLDVVYQGSCAKYDSRSVTNVWYNKVVDGLIKELNK